MNSKRLLNNVAIVAKHLEKNERYFRYPEKKVLPIIKETEEHMRSFEKQMSSWSKYFS
ncbi:hypothetical protein [Paraliobacillus salinarum]|uniref:hypothetical protein n=1 Tax=Paraliobacillus salinarum TaxID=1158996 RepID=UPI0015F39D5E|nr:hypothetical protein [Paraliobacillus salinarum]